VYSIYLSLENAASLDHMIIINQIMQETRLRDWRGRDKGLREVLKGF
jgi:hypothetical protein